MWGPVRIIVTSACVQLLGPPAPAHAGEPSPAKLALAPLKLEGDAAPRVRDALQQSLVRGLSGDENEVALLDTTCESQSCFAAQARSSGASYVLEARIDVQVNDYNVVLTALGPAGHQLQSVKFTCEICTPQEAAATVRKEASALRDTLLRVQPPADPRSDDARAQLSVSSDPSGARVIIDGRATGATPYDVEITPGAHALRLELDGYKPQEVQFEASHGQRATFALALVPVQGGARKRLRVAGYATLGAGIGTLVAGAVLLGLDNRPIRSRCTGASKDLNGECEFLHDTLTAGAIVTAVGAAALIAGISMAVVGRKRSRPAHRSKTRRAEVTVTPIGLCAAF